METSKKYANFLDYINSVLSRESIMVLYDANNIRYDRVQLFNDFVQSLLSIVFDTYMGDDVTSVEQQIDHFQWCWNKNIDNFTKEGIVFKSITLYDYFLAYILEIFYLSDKKTLGISERTAKKLWLELFDYDKPKTNSDVDTFIEIYHLMESSLELK